MCMRTSNWFRTLQRRPKSYDGLSEYNRVSWTTPLNMFAVMSTPTTMENFWSLVKRQLHVTWKRLTGKEVHERDRVGEAA